MYHKIHESFFIFFMFLCSSLLGETLQMDANKGLEKYRESIRLLEKISMQVEMESKWTDHAEDESGRRSINFIYRQDGSDFQWEGESLSLDKKGEIDPIASPRMQDIATGNEYHYVHGPALEDPFYVRISRDNDSRLKELLDDPDHGGFLRGRIFGNNHNSIADLLGQSQNLRLLDGCEIINEMECMVLEGQTQYGLAKVWISPEKGYSAIKWSLHKTKQSLFNDKPIEGEDWIAIYEVNEIESFDNCYVASSGRFTLKMKLNSKEESIDESIFTISNIEINPDFKAMGAFQLDVPDGTRVFLSDSPGIRYEWSNGKIITAVDEKFLNKLNNEIDKGKIVILNDSNKRNISVVASNKPASPRNTIKVSKTIKVKNFIQIHLIKVIVALLIIIIVLFFTLKIGK